MGAWSVQPMQNDAALDWMYKHVSQHLLDEIESTLKIQQHGSGREEEAEAAAALLVDCTSGAARTRYRTIDLSYEANSRGLWALAVKVVDAISRSEWVDDWKEPQKKVDALKELKAELERAEEEYKKAMA
jgi:hypothetical protein